MITTQEPTIAGAIPTTMRAVVCYAPGDYRLETVAVPQPGLFEVLTRVEAVGICMGDIKTFHGARSIWGGGGEPVWAKPPVIPGHEFIGRVVALGEGAAERHGVAVGNRVIAEQIVPCWSCRFCKRGEYWMCERHDIFGFQKNVNGGMAEYMLYPRGAIVHRVPDDVPVEEAIVIEPLSCSMHAADRGKITEEDVVVVAGAGTLGLGIVGAVRRKNPAKLIVLDIRASRLEHARRLGADLTIDTLAHDAVAEVKALTEGYGCDVFIEATGYPPMVNMGMAMIRKLGRFVEFSVFNGETSLDWSIIGDRKELDIYGAHLGPYTYPRAIRYVADRTIDVRGIVTHQFPLERWREAFETMERGTESLKVILRP